MYGNNDLTSMNKKQTHNFIYLWPTIRFLPQLKAIVYAREYALRFCNQDLRLPQLKATVYARE